MQILVKQLLKLSEDGKSYTRLTDKKCGFQTQVFVALMIVFARIENDKNITGFIVEYDQRQPKWNYFR